jgi:hypothetical protein
MIQLVTLTGILAILHTHTKLPSRRDPKVVSFTVRCAGVAAWPLIIAHLCPRCPHVVPGTVWLLLLEVLNAFVLMDPASSKGLYMEKGSFLGVAFALAAMSGNRPDSAHAPLFVYAVLGMFLTVLPTHDLSDGSVSGAVVDSVQRVLLHYSIAMFVTAILLTRSPSA